MKKIFVLILFTGSLFSLHAQRNEKPKGLYTSQTVSKDTTVNADTTNVDMPAIGGNLTSIDVEVKLVTGTIGGKVFLYGRTGAQWNLLDSSATISATVPFKTFLFDRAKYTYYKDYRCQYRTTGTQTSYLVVSTVRRTDEE